MSRLADKESLYEVGARVVRPENPTRVGVVTARYVEYAVKWPEYREPIIYPARLLTPAPEDPTP